VSVVMHYGLINKVAINLENVIDAKCLGYVMPSGGAVHTDKVYCLVSSRVAAARKGVHL
tara:strand:+ start:230 stop:406 length:177 start_codon:yes stop_codon:yes gene_type:complete